ncbi:O-acetyl-ADP-ribose deacetylase [Microbulbifer sp. NBRC 101763]|uniref:macro domain-containing protein n=1 Tax=unclassified Microbulbifer TaxID=2619833 RepID=UPI0024ADA3C0|nr:macro domain-containing protein [Microbulbifer sp. MLAF003]WHI51459.1 macro domain-containing protein [Microbulbifer sp. MLAF003]
MTQIILTWGDILTLRGDALVCPAHKHLICGRGLSAQVFALGGKDLELQCKKQPECTVGEARITDAFHMPVDYLLHTVTPQWSSGDQWGAQAIKQLRYCYESVLSLAGKKGLKHILFPALGAGTNRFPHAIAAHEALEVLNEYSSQFDQLTVCLHSPAALGEWKRVERRFFTV